IGTVSTPEKATLAQENGCTHTILYTQEDWVEKVKELTEGKGVDVVYDSVGKTTFTGSLDCLKRFGMMVSYGQSSGAVPPLDISILSQKGGLYLTRPTLMHHIEDEANYQKMAGEVLELVARQILTMRIGGMYHLEEVKQAHIDLESRKTTGALILQP
ncbi:MAG: zinc-binding dehydrogenase, partial [Rickettsiales bacterium]|nr:zinc-binding dehydrogenase [Rickettsiales bacterium]